MFDTRLKMDKIFFVSLHNAGVLVVPDRAEHFSKNWTYRSRKVTLSRPAAAELSLNVLCSEFESL